MTGQNNTTFSSIDDQNVELSNGTKYSVSSLETIMIATLLSPIIVLGIVGNMFSLIVWMKGRRRKTSTARYLSTLAVVDILVLGLPATELWIQRVLHFSLTDTIPVVCKLWNYISYLLPAISAWILVAVTIERAISVCSPHRVSVVCRPNIAVVLVLAMTILICLVYLPVYIGFGLQRVVNETTDGEVPVSYDKCIILSSSLGGNIFIVIDILDLLVFFVFPFSIMLICNICILLKVNCVARRHINMFQERGRQPMLPHIKREKKLKTVTRRIIILSTTYLICNAPLCIFFAVFTFDDNAVPYDHNFYQTLFLIFMYLNNGANFLLYCLIGSGFRKDFIEIFKCGTRSFIL